MKIAETPLKTAISVLAVIFLFLSGSALQAKDFLQVKVLSKNTRPGDAVIIKLDSSYEVKEARVFIEVNRPVPCMNLDRQWYCVAGISAVYPEKSIELMFDIKTKEPHFLMLKEEIPVGKKMFPKIPWSAPQPLPGPVEARVLQEKKTFKTKIEKSLISFVPSGAFIAPLVKIKKVTSLFGERRIRPRPYAPRIHNGVDLRAGNGTQVFSPNDGVVEIADEFYFEGGFILIDHGGGIKSDFMHLSNLAVKAGDKVSRGQIIGYSGSTGAGISAPHLHFEIWVHDTPVDPLKFIKDFNKAIF